MHDFFFLHRSKKTQILDLLFKSLWEEYSETSLIVQDQELRTPVPKDLCTNVADYKICFHFVDHGMEL